MSCPKQNKTRVWTSTKHTFLDLICNRNTYVTNVCTPCLTLYSRLNLLIYLSSEEWLNFIIMSHATRLISEFPSQTCVLLLLSLHIVCHVTIAHCNDSNGTDTRVRVRCNDSDVTDRKQSRVCNDSTVTDMSWAIVTCDGHINCWQSKVWTPQNMELPYTEWNLIAYQRYNVPDKETDVSLSQ